MQPSDSMTVRTADIMNHSANHSVHYTLQTHNHDAMVGAMNMEMMMVFHLSKDFRLLFHSWKIHDNTTLGLACFTVFLMAFAYEALKMEREQLVRRFLQPKHNIREQRKLAQHPLHDLHHEQQMNLINSNPCNSCAEADNEPQQSDENLSLEKSDGPTAAPPLPECVITIEDSTRLEDTKHPPGIMVIRVAFSRKLHLLQTMLHVLQTALGYLLMLVVMTYSVWLCLSTLLGVGCGYLLFGWRRILLESADGAEKPICGDHGCH